MKKQITKSLLVNGLLPMLIVLKEQEQLENYEFCQSAIEAIRETFPNDNTIPTQYSDDAVEWLRTEFYRLGFSGDTAIGNTNGYVNRIYRELGMKRTYDSFISIH